MHFANRKNFYLGVDVCLQFAVYSVWLKRVGYFFVFILFGFRTIFVVQIFKCFIFKFISKFYPKVENVQNMNPELECVGCFQTLIEVDMLLKMTLFSRARKLDILLAF